MQKTITNNEGLGKQVMHKKISNNSAFSDLYNTISKIISKNNEFVIITHISPDADTCGSSLALSKYLRELGKKAIVICDGNAADLPVDLFGDEKVYNINEANFSAKCAIAIDCADAERMGRAAEIFDKAEVKILLDHHKSNVGFGDYFIIDPSAAATAELVYKLLVVMNAEISKEIASLLYYAMLGDTGGFSYSNTTPQTLSIASDLLSCGVSSDRIYDLMFRNIKYTKAKLLGFLLTTCELYCDGKICAGIIEKSTILNLDALDSNSEGFVEKLRDIEGVLVSIYIKQSYSGMYKVSMRSKGDIDIAKIASEFGGGGHTNAAGFTWHGEAKEILYKLIKIISDIV